MQLADVHRALKFALLTLALTCLGVAVPVLTQGSLTGNRVVQDSGYLHKSVVTYAFGAGKWTYLVDNASQPLSSSEVPEWLQSTPMPTQMTLLSCGFPIRWIDGAMVFQPGQRPTLQGGVEIEMPWKKWLLVPLHIRYGDLALCLAVNAMTVFCVDSGIRALRFYSRLKRGLCTKCGYAVKSISICPECGQSQRAKQRVPDNLVSEHKSSDSR